jgi:cation transport ATPase
VEEAGFRAVQVFGARLRIEGAAAEADQPAAAVGDGEHHPVAEAVVGRAAALGRDQQAGVDQFAGRRALGDEVVLERGPARRRVAEAEAAPRLGGRPRPVR